MTVSNEPLLQKQPSDAKKRWIKAVTKLTIYHKFTAPDGAHGVGFHHAKMIDLQGAAKRITVAVGRGAEVAEAEAGVAPPLPLPPCGLLHGDALWCRNRRWW